MTLGNVAVSLVVKGILVGVYIKVLQYGTLYTIYAQNAYQRLVSLLDMFTIIYCVDNFNL